MSEHIAVRLSEDMARELDELVQAEEYATRAEAVRAAIAQLLERQRRHRVGAAIVAGYRRTPQTDEEFAVAAAAAIRSINEEPW